MENGELQEARKARAVNSSLLSMACFRSRCRNLAARAPCSQRMNSSTEVSTVVPAASAAETDGTPLQFIPKTPKDSNPLENELQGLRLAAHVEAVDARHAP